MYIKRIKHYQALKCRYSRFSKKNKGTWNYNFYNLFNYIYNKWFTNNNTQFFLKFPRLFLHLGDEPVCAFYKFFYKIHLLFLGNLTVSLKKY